jgi:hypothetical protein
MAQLTVLTKAEEAMACGLLDGLEMHYKSAEHHGNFAN